MASAQIALRAACTSVCAGNLSENIYPNGDFGFGSANILLNDPGLAPGYIYQLHPPPDDGYYTITNNTSPWGSFAGFWVDIPDNGPEADGYMMVVNASYQPGLFFENTIEVCENTLYEFSVDVISLFHIDPTYNPIAPELAFLIDGVTVCETGKVPSDETWHTYRFSFTAAPGSTQVKLSMRNNAPGGFGNDLALDNISFRTCGPLIGLPAEPEFCPGHPMTLQASLVNSPYPTPYFQWQTSTDNGANWINLPGANSASLPIASPAEDVLYRLIVANLGANLSLPNCRVISAGVELVPEDLSNFEIGGTDTLVCNGAPAVLEAGHFGQYQWSTGDTGAMLKTLIPGWYAVTITSELGCVASDSIEVFESVVSAEANWQEPICFGDSTGQIFIEQAKGGFGNLSFAIDDGDPQAEPFFEHLPGGMHQVLAIDSLGCTLALPITLTYPPRFELLLGEDLQIMACDTVALEWISNEPAYGFQWLPGEGLSCNDCPYPVAMPLRSTLYTLAASNSVGCRSSDSLFIKVFPRLEVYAPNIFLGAPDNSGPNNFFTLFTTKSAVMVRRLEIFDRWGELVFHRRDLPPGSEELHWDGSDFRGKLPTTGVYTWLAEIEFTDGTTHAYHGDMLLLR